jgi:hypothetical protein
LKNYGPQLSRKQLHAICDAHNIPARDRAALAGLVYHGKPVGARLFPKIDGRWRGSRKNGEYARFLVAILEAPSAPVYAQDRFPPKGWQPTEAQLARIGG